MSDIVLLSLAVKSVRTEMLETLDQERQQSRLKNETPAMLRQYITTCPQMNERRWRLPLQVVGYHQYGLVVGFCRQKYDS